MEVEQRQGSSASISYRSHADEKAIEVCEKLLSSGHSFSEILVVLKRLSSTDEVGSSERGDGPHKELLEIARKSAGPDAAPLEARSQAASGALVVDGAGPEAARSLVVLPASPSMRTARATKSKSSSLLAAALFGLIPALALSIVGIASKLLIDADPLWNKAIAGYQTDNTALSAPTVEDTRAAPPIEASQFETVHAAEPVVTGPSAPLAAEALVTAPVRMHHSGSRTRYVVRPRFAPIERQWDIPRRLTDGL